MNALDKNLLKASFIGTAAENMLAPIYSLYILKVGGNILDAGIAFILFNIVKGIFVLTFGQTDLFKKNLHLWVMVGFFVSALCDCDYIFIDNQYQFFVVQIIAGLSLGVINPAWESLYSDTDSLQEAGSKWSLWNGGADFATGIAALIGACLVKYASWNSMFVIMMSISLWSTYYAYLVWRDRYVSWRGIYRINETIYNIVVKDSAHPNSANGVYLAPSGTLYFIYVDGFPWITVSDEVHKQKIYEYVREQINK